VNWDDCQTFISRLNSITGRSFSLPTEAQWEFAARGGNSTLGYKYSGSNNVYNVAWYYGNSGNVTHDVGTKAANELGLYDMSGNVLEWCSDMYGNYSSNSQTNPTGPYSGSDRVGRGGNWGNDARSCRVSSRGGITPDYRCSNMGLRLVL
jgi:formylglycine-generating enzyme required for sulfatase activity